MPEVDGLFGGAGDEKCGIETVPDYGVDGGEKNNNRREERDQALHLSAPTVQDNFTLVQLNCPAAPALAPFKIK